MPSLAPLEMPLLSAYSRRQAIEDGVLVDPQENALGEVTRQHFKVHVAMTAAVFANLEREVAARHHSDDLRRLWHDVCWSLRITISRQPEDSSISELLFRVISGAGRPKYWTFKAVMGPDDEGAPCLTIMLPDED